VVAGGPRAAVSTQSGQSAGIRALADGEPARTASLVTAPAIAGGPASDAVGNSVVPASGQGVEKPLQPLTFATHTAN
jgi:hypothetical protein